MNSPGAQGGVFRSGSCRGTRFAGLGGSLQSRIGDGDRVRVRAGRRFQDFGDGDRGVACSVDQDCGSCEVVFEGRLAPVRVALRHLELESPAEPIAASSPRRAAVLSVASSPASPQTPTSPRLPPPTPVRSASLRSASVSAASPMSPAASSLACSGAAWQTRPVVALEPAAADSRQDWPAAQQPQAMLRWQEVEPLVPFTCRGDSTSGSRGPRYAGDAEAIGELRLTLDGLESAFKVEQTAREALGQRIESLAGQREALSELNRQVQSMQQALIKSQSSTGPAAQQLEAMLRKRLSPLEDHLRELDGRIESAAATVAVVQSMASDLGENRRRAIEEEPPWLQGLREELCERLDAFEEQVHQRLQSMGESDTGWRVQVLEQALVDRIVRMEEQLEVSLSRIKDLIPGCRDEVLPAPPPPDWADSLQELRDHLWSLDGSMRRLTGLVGSQQRGTEARGLADAALDKVAELSSQLAGLRLQRRPEADQELATDTDSCQQLSLLREGMVLLKQQHDRQDEHLAQLQEQMGELGLACASVPKEEDVAMCTQKVDVQREQILQVQQGIQVLTERHTLQDEEIAELSTHLRELSGAQLTQQDERLAKLSGDIERLSGRHVEQDRQVEELARQVRQLAPKQPVEQVQASVNRLEGETAELRKRLAAQSDAVRGFSAAFAAFGAAASEAPRGIVISGAAREGPPAAAFVVGPPSRAESAAADGPQDPIAEGELDTRDKDDLGLGSAGDVGYPQRSVPAARCSPTSPAGSLRSLGGVDAGARGM